jgi:diaminopimelate epimerase
VAVPNPHVISVVEEYSEPDLIELGKRAGEVFAAGANVSFLQPLDSAAGVAREVFVRTFERGAGLTPSCGSGVVASRAAYSRVSGLDPAERVVVRNAGGVAATSVHVRDGDWYPLLEGNATIVYRARVDLAGNQAGPVEWAVEENAAYATLDERNTTYLKLHGIETAHP